MAITQAMCTSFKKALLDGEMDFSSNTGQSYNIALIKSGSSGTFGAATTSYTDLTGSSDEVTGTGYTAGGNLLGISTVPTTSGTTAFLSFNTTTWTTATITAAGALIYQVGGSTPAVAVLNFGGDKTSTAGNFQITFPAANATEAIIRIA
jgi:hypothetical protein